MKNTTPKPFLFACVLALALCSLPKAASAQNLPNLTPSQVQQIVQSAEQGDATAQTKLGFMYEKGLGVAKDDKLAAQWYQKAAEQGNATAQSNLRLIYQKAAEAGDAEAQTKLGFMYEKGLGVPQDYKLAMQWYQKAAAQGNATAQSNLRLIYQKAAEQGDAEAQTKLGFMYEKGLGVPQDYKLAMQWYQKAAAQGNATAQSNLRLIYQKAAEAGDAEAQVKLGVMYEKGEEPRTPYGPAVRRIQRAAEQGHPAAQYDLAQMHVEGRWVCPSYELAVQWYERAALQGHPAAQYELGVIYHKGARGVPQNHKLAAQWYHKAAAQGHASAQYKLGVMYYRGRGVPRDDKQAYIWLSLAVGNGVKSSKSLYEGIARRLRYQHNIKAQANIGLMYKNGKGLPKSYVQAYAWFLVAFANGEASAKALGDAVAQKLSPQQREAAQKQAALIQKRIDSRANKKLGSKKLWK